MGICAGGFVVVIVLEVVVMAVKTILIRTGCVTGLSVFSGAH